MSISRLQLHGGVEEYNNAGGGAQTHNLALDKKFHVVETADTNEIYQLPEKRWLDGGGPLYTVMNDAGVTILVHDEDSTLIATLLSTELAEFYLSDGGAVSGEGVRTWYKRIMTKNGSRLLS